MYLLLLLISWLILLPRTNSEHTPRLLAAGRGVSEANNGLHTIMVVANSCAMCRARYDDPSGDKVYINLAAARIDDKETGKTTVYDFDSLPSGYHVPSDIKDCTSTSKTVSVAVIFQVIFRPLGVTACLLSCL